MADKLTVGLAQLMMAVDGFMLSAGAAVALTTVAELTLVQPLPPVNVTEYVSADATLMLFDNAPVDQRALPVPTTDNTADGLVQVSVTEDGVMLRLGATLSASITILVWLIQPAAFATVTE